MDRSPKKYLLIHKMGSGGDTDLQNRTVRSGVIDRVIKAER